MTIQTIGTQIRYFNYFYRFKSDQKSLILEIFDQAQEKLAKIAAPTTNFSKWCKIENTETLLNLFIQNNLIPAYFLPSKPVVDLTNSLEQLILNTKCKASVEIDRSCVNPEEYEKALESYSKAFQYNDWRRYLELPKLFEKIGSFETAKLAYLYLALDQLLKGEENEALQIVEHCKQNTSSSHQLNTLLTQLYHATNQNEKIGQLGIQVKEIHAFSPWVIGAEKWMKYLGDPGDEPPLPLDVIQRFRNNLEFGLQNVLVLIPKTVNGTPLNLKTMGELVQNPLHGCFGAKFSYLLLGDYVDKPVSESHWWLVTRTLIKGSRKTPYNQVPNVLAKYGEEKKISYEIPCVLDMAIGLFMIYLRLGIWIYEPQTYVWCQEQYNLTHQLVLGGSGNGLDIYFHNASGAHEDCGVAGGLRL